MGYLAGERYILQNDDSYGHKTYAQDFTHHGS